MSPKLLEENENPVLGFVEALFLILIPKLDAVEIGFRPEGNGACLGAREAEFFVGTTRVWPDFFEPR